MRNKVQMYLLLAGVAALALNTSTSSGQVFDPVDARNNRAIAASPRAIEAFPWLTRTQSTRTNDCCVANELSEVKKNRALAASPRALEQFPELTRSGPARPEFSIAPLVEKNTTVLSSPRAREQFPALSRGTTPGTAKGGASKLMELGK